MKNIFFLFFVIYCSHLFAQSNKTPEKWTLENCIQYALDNNITIKQSQLNVINADIDESDAIGNFLPSLNINANNSWNSGLTQNVVTGVLENQVTRNFSFGATVGIDIFRGLQNWRNLQRAKINKIVNLYSLEQREDDIALFVANAYLQVLVSKQSLAILEEQNLVTIEQIKLAQNQVDAGTIPQGDLLDIQATNADEQRQIVTAQNDVRISLISLAQTLLIEDYENFDIADESYDVPITDILSKDISEILEKSKKERYEIKIEEKNLELAEKDVEIAKSLYYPTLQGFFNYNTRETDLDRVIRGDIDPNQPTTQIGIVEDTGQSVVVPNFLAESVGPRSFTDQLYQNDGISYGLQLSIPIFNGFSARNNVKRSEINLERQKNQLKQAELDLESNVYQAYVDAQGALKSYEAALKVEEARQIAYNYAKERFDVGMSNSFELSQSKLNLTNAQNTLIRAKYDYIFSLKVLELYFGIRTVD